MRWWWIILWLIIFWPVGLLFLLRKIATDKSAVMTNHKIVTIISFVLMGIGGLSLLTNIITLYFGITSMLYSALLIGGGFWLNNLGKKMKATGERYKKYIDVVVNRNETSIDNIAATVGVPYSDALEDLRKMIEAGYFAGAYLDTNSRRIVLAQTHAGPFTQGMASQPQEKVVTCNGCGANNKVFVGLVTMCEYCGSPLQ